MADRRVLQRLIHDTAVDEQTIRNKVAKLTATDSDLAVGRARFFHDLRGVFTPDQVQKPRESREHRHARTDELLVLAARHLAKD